MPRKIFPNLIGHPKKLNSLNDKKNEDYIIGNAAISKKIFLNINYPVESGFITNWENMEKILHYTFFTELLIPPADCKIIITETPNNEKKDREKLTQILFETFDFPSMFF
jgi:actin-related protein